TERTARHLPDGDDPSLRGAELDPPPRAVVAPALAPRQRRKSVRALCVYFTPRATLALASHAGPLACPRTRRPLPGAECERLGRRRSRRGTSGTGQSRLLPVGVGGRRASALGAGRDAAAGAPAARVPNIRRHQRTGAVTPSQIWAARLEGAAA